MSTMTEEKERKVEGGETREDALVALVERARAARESDERDDDERARAMAIVTELMANVANGRTAGGRARERAQKGAEEVVACARVGSGDECARVVAEVMRAVEIAVGCLPCDESRERVVRETIVHGLVHRSSAVRVASTRALGAALDAGDRRGLVKYLTGCHAPTMASRAMNYFGALICDGSASVRTEFTRVLGRCLVEDDGAAPRVLPYVLTSLRDDIDDVRDAAQEIVNAMGTEKFNNLVRRNLGDILIPALDELSAHAGTGWQEHITFRTLTLINTLVCYANDCVIQFVPNIYDGMRAVIANERTEARAKIEAQGVLSALVSVCPDAAVLLQSG